MLHLSALAESPVMPSSIFSYSPEPSAPGAHLCVSSHCNLALIATGTSVGGPDLHADGLYGLTTTTAGKLLCRC